MTPRKPIYRGSLNSPRRMFGEQRVEIKPFVLQDVEFLLIGTEQFADFDRHNASAYVSRVKAAANPHEEVGCLLKEAFSSGFQSSPGKPQAGLVIFFQSPSQQKFKTIKKYIEVASNEKQPPRVTDENVKPATHPNILQSGGPQNQEDASKHKKLKMQPAIAETIHCDSTLRLDRKHPQVSDRREILIQHTLYLDDL